MRWNAQPKKANQKSAQKKRLASLWLAFSGCANFVKPPFYSYQLTVISEQFWNACGGGMLSGAGVWGIELTIVDGRWTGDTDGEVN